MEGGHFIPRGKIPTKLIEENVNPQCVRCNKFDQEYAKIQYRRYMDETYGAEFVEELEALSRTVKKYTRSEAEDILEDLKAQLKDLEGR